MQHLQYKGSRPADGSPAGLLQRTCACGQHASDGGECEECKQKREGKLQRAAIAPAPDLAPPVVQEVLRSPGQPLDEQTRAYMEPRFGHDFSNVRVHTGDQAAESARTVNALAYTVGNHVAFGDGQYQPDSSDGKRLLAHELAHVVQQSRLSSLVPPLAAESTLEEDARRAAATIEQGSTADVRRASSPGLARQERWLQENPDPQAMSDDELYHEIQLIHRRLIDNPETNSEHERLRQVLTLFEHEAIARQVRRSGQARSGREAATPTEGNLGAAPTIAAAGVAIALPSVASSATPAVGTAGAATGGEALLGGLAVPLAAIVAFFGVLLYPSSTIVSGAEEQRMLEEARRAQRSSAQPTTSSPGTPNLGQALNLLRTTITALGTGIVLAMTAEEIERHRGRIQGLLDQIEELVKANPQLAMRCSQQLIAFRQAVQAALDYLSGAPDSLNAFLLRRLLDAIQQAVSALLNCMGVVSP